MSRSHHGFSLIEVITTTSIAALLLGLAFPPFVAVMQRQAATTEHNRLLGALHLARTLAVTRREDTIVCPVDARGGCRTDGVWDLGWITFGDRNGNLRLDPGETIHRNESRDADALLIRSSAARSRVVFRRNGMTRGSNMTLRLCGPEREVLSALVVNNHGRTRAATRDEIRRDPRCAT